MKILLVVAPYRYPHPQAFKTELLGILYLSANLRAHGHEIAILDPTIGAPTKLPDGKYLYSIPEEAMAEKLRSFAPEVVGISSHYAFSRSEAFAFAALAKRLLPAAVTVMGGLVATIYTKKVLAECPALDYALIGEAEQSFLDLLGHLAVGTPALEAVDGLIHRVDGEVVVNPKRAFISDLDSLPFPARDLVDIERYMNTGTSLYGVGGVRALSLLTSRSCPNQCTFCNMWLVHGKRWRPRGVDNVLGEIDEMLNRFKARDVHIMDDNFVFNPDRAKQICEGIIRKGYRFRWNTPNGISVRGIDAELTKLMKRAGCANVCVAIESGSEYIRNTVMKKRTTNEQIIDAVRHFKDAKIPVGGFFLLGMPGETRDRFRETVTFARRLPLSFIATAFATPYPGTQLYTDLVAAGVIPDGYELPIDDLAHPIFETADFTKADLVQRKKDLLLSFYFGHAPQILREAVSGRLNWVNSPKQLFNNTLLPLIKAAWPGGAAP